MSHHTRLQEPGLLQNVSYTISQVLDTARNDWEASDSFWVNVKVPEGLIERKKIDTGFAVFVVQKRVQMLPRERGKQSDSILRPKKNPPNNKQTAMGTQGLVTVVCMAVNQSRLHRYLCLVLHFTAAERRGPL